MKSSAFFKSVLVVILLASGSQVSAQSSVQLNHFRAAETSEDGFSVSRPGDRGSMRFGVHLNVDYGNNPLVFEREAGVPNSQLTAIVSDQLTGNLGLSLGLVDRLVLFVGIPVNFVMDGRSQPGYWAADGAGLSDVYAGLRLRIFGERNDVFAAAVQLAATFPTANLASPASASATLGAPNSGQHYSGDQGVVFVPELLLEVRPLAGFSITGNIGARLRLDDRARLPSLSVSQELTFALGVTIPFIRDRGTNLFSGHLEAFGTSSFDSFGQSSTTPFEALAGVRIQPIDGLFVGAAGGPGIVRGYGSPLYRLIGTIGWAEPVTAVGPAASTPDTDRDGLDDLEDGCPSEPEDQDGFEDDNGCPDVDNDGDGVLDAADQCPNEAEDVDGFADEDGCIEPDNDGDGILDDRDGAPLEPEDQDGFQDADGIPDVDNDGDGVMDVDDACPLAPGRPSTTQGENGCPTTIQFDPDSGTIRILQRIEFASGRDTLLPSATPILEEVRAVLAVNPQIIVMRVEGHTDDRGADRRNLELSARRAQAVRRWLSEQGIEAERLSAFGCGELHPIESNRSGDGRQANRRVEFHVVNPAPPQGARNLEGCLEAQQ